MKKDESDLLSPEQKKILKHLLAELKILKRFNGRTIEEIQQLTEKERSFFDFHQEEYKEVMLKAIRARLHVHPRIERGRLSKLFANFIDTHRALGDWDLFRKLRSLKVSVKRPYNREQAEFLNAVYGVIEELQWGCKEPSSGLEAGSNEASMESGENFMENALQRARLSRVFDPENPPPKPREEPISISEVHQELIRRGIVKSTLQSFTRRLERLDPHFRSRKKRRKKRKVDSKFLSKPRFA
jgi:hypothetical protein